MIVITLGQSLAGCLILACLFVGGLYTAPQKVKVLPRDHPDQVNYISNSLKIENRKLKKKKIQKQKQLYSRHIIFVALSKLCADPISIQIYNRNYYSFSAFRTFLDGNKLVCIYFSTLDTKNS